MKKIALNDLTRAELLTLIQYHGHGITNDDVTRVRQQSMFKKANIIMDEAQAESRRLAAEKPKTTKGKLANITAFMTQGEKWDRGNALWNKASELYGT